MLHTDYKFQKCLELFCTWLSHIPYVNNTLYDFQYYIMWYNLLSIDVLTYITTLKHRPMIRYFCENILKLVDCSFYCVSLTRDSISENDDTTIGY